MRVWLWGCVIVRLVAAFIVQKLNSSPLFFTSNSNDISRSRIPRSKFSQSFPIPSIQKSSILANVMALFLLIRQKRSDHIIRSSCDHRVNDQISSKNYVEVHGNIPAELPPPHPHLPLLILGPNHDIMRGWTFDILRNMAKLRTDDSDEMEYRNDCSELWSRSARMPPIDHPHSAVELLGIVFRE